MGTSAACRLLNMAPVPISAVVILGINPNRGADKRAARPSQVKCYTNGRRMGLIPRLRVKNQALAEGVSLKLHEKSYAKD